MKQQQFFVNVEAAIYKDGRWLMIKRGAKEPHAAGTISLVGGKVDWEANAHDEYDILEKTAIREVKEEIDINLEPDMDYLASSSFVSDDKRVFVDVVFLCKKFNGQPKIIAADEVSDIVWLTTEEVLQHPNIIDWTKHVINTAAKKI